MQAMLADNRLPSGRGDAGLRVPALVRLRCDGFEASALHCGVKAGCEAVVWSRRRAPATSQHTAHSHTDAVT